MSQCVSNEATCHLSNVSACPCQRGQPTVAGEEQLQQASTMRPDTRVPEHVVWLWRHAARVTAPRPGHRQLSTRQTAADLWLRTGMAPLIRLSVSCSTVRRSWGFREVSSGLSELFCEVLLTKNKFLCPGSPSQLIFTGRTQMSAAL